MSAVRRASVWVDYGLELGIPQASEQGGGKPGFGVGTGFGYHAGELPAAVALLDQFTSRNSARLDVRGNADIRLGRKPGSEDGQTLDR